MKNKHTSKRLMDIYNRLFERFGPQHWWPGETKTEIIIGAILTQNTNWENVKKAILNLKKARMLNFPALKDINVNALAELIRPSGYYNIKAKRLKNFVDFFFREYGGSWKKFQAQPLPLLREHILSVNGVGPETGDSILLYALGKPVFVIDAFTKRALIEHKLIKADADYHSVQKLFMDNLEPDVLFFNEYHALFVRLAKEHCRTKPLCEKCPLEKV
ncbi:MAG: endonuclease III domain-containing protein [Candidatus Omnitrophota bacterium]